MNSTTSNQHQPLWTVYPLFKQFETTSKSNAARRSPSCCTAYSDQVRACFGNIQWHPMAQHTREGWFMSIINSCQMLNLLLCFIYIYIYIYIHIYICIYIYTYEIADATNFWSVNVNYMKNLYIYIHHQLHDIDKSYLVMLVIEDEWYWCISVLVVSL